MPVKSGSGSCNMWKYASRRCRDTFERGVNYFDKRSAAGITNPQNCTNESKESDQSSPCRWFQTRTCWGSFHGSRNNTNRKKWNFDHLNGSWLSAITWSSALILGWYAGQVIHLKHKYSRHDKKCALPSIAQALKPYVNYVGFSNKSAPLLHRPRLDKPISDFTPTVYLISNDHSKSNNTAKQSTSNSGSSAKTESSDGDLGEVLNSIENRLGLAAIESGQHKEGLNLLRSAANRHHAPALYNLGLCYEMGLGVKVDEKVAMELYRSAATLEHASAMYNLGIYYGQGRGGLARDTQTATRLFRLAAVKGNQGAIEALKSLEVEAEPASPREHDMAPTHSALFISHVNTLMVQM